MKPKICPSKLSLAAAPSRLDNPFATCWTRPGAIPFRFSDGYSAESLVAKLAAQNWWGAIIGPHGSGKSTLIETLKPALVAAGHGIHAICLREGQRRLPSDWWHEPSPPGRGQSEGASVFGDSSSPQPSPKGRGSVFNRLLIIDGYEQLALFERMRLANRCRRAAAGLLVTSHKPVRVPALIRLSPDRCLAEQLVADLCAKVSTAVTPLDVAASHACHGSNVREILFDLYDRHEQRRRGSNALPAAS